MRVIFLDFDGVLTSVGAIIHNNRERLMGKNTGDSFESFDTIACSNLQYILEELTDVQIVISSTWRKKRNLKALQKLFDKNNIISDRIIGKTPVSKTRYRGNEIKAYLKNHPEIDTFVIVDDDSDMKPYMDRLIRTDSRNGLTFSDAEKVVELLGGKNEKK